MSAQMFPAHISKLLQRRQHKSGARETVCSCVVKAFSNSKKDNRKTINGSDDDVDNIFDIIPGV